MKGLMVGLLGLILSVAVVNARDDAPKVAALKPVPLDAAFTNATSPRDITNALLNDPTFKKAVAAAAKAKADNIAAKAQNPKLMSATPDQAARVAFLKVLNDGAND
jgi:hypothetical protein